MGAGKDRATRPNCWQNLLSQKQLRHEAIREEQEGRVGRCDEGCCVLRLRWFLLLQNRASHLFACFPGAEHGGETTLVTDGVPEDEDHIIGIESQSVEWMGMMQISMHAATISCQGRFDSGATRPPPRLVRPLGGSRQWTASVQCEWCPDASGRPRPLFASLIL